VSILTYQYRGTNNEVLCPYCIMDYDQFFKLVGQKIRRLRIEKGFPAYDGFAFTHEIPRHNLLRAEQGKPITGLTLIKILNALEVSPEEFFKGIK
jgi:hypothetical protein